MEEGQVHTCPFFVREYLEKTTYQMDTIKINGVDYNFKQTFRGLLQFEELTGKSLDKMTGSLTDLFILFYCFLSACNQQTFKYTFDEFLNLVEEQPELVAELSSALKPQAIVEEDKKKVVSKKKISK